MNRREVIRLAAAIAAYPAVARAQPTVRPQRLGVLALSPRTLENLHPAFLPELARLGFVEGQNLELDFRPGPEAELPRLADEIVRGGADVILAIASHAAGAAQARTSTVPIVMFGGEDAIVEGFATTLARPGSNVTAVVILSTQLEPKRLNLLHDAAPAARRIAALLYEDRKAGSERQADELRRAATALGLDLQIVQTRRREDFPLAFAAMQAHGAEALLIGAHALLFSHREELAALALRAGLPTVCEWATMARDGCLLGYGPNRDLLYRIAAMKVARLFRGAAPGDLPIEQPASFEFAINLATARALGLTISPLLLARADEVIE
jgi:putative ABC transport system substrate-binding protein